MVDKVLHLEILLGLMREKAWKSCRRKKDKNYSFLLCVSLTYFFIHNCRDTKKHQTAPTIGCIFYWSCMTWESNTFALNLNKVGETQ